MHLQWREAGAIGTNAIVGGGVPLALGSAWAHRFSGSDDVASVLDAALVKRKVTEI